MKYPIDSRNKVRRVPSRGSYDHASVYQVLDATHLAHVSFVVEGQPFIIPTLYGRDKNAIYIHGSSASRIIRTLTKGVPCALAVTLEDGLVLARSAFHHSMNYRSVVLFGTAVPVQGDEKLHALKIISENVLPGRWEEVRGPNRKELKGTSVLKIEIDQASAKIRTGPPKDEIEDYDLDVWAGVIPFRQQRLPAVEDPDATAPVPLPKSVLDYLKKNE